MAVFFTHYVTKRYENQRSRYREEYLRNQQKSSNDYPDESSTSLLPLPQKLIREEVERLQTFSPVRKIFYAGPEDIVRAPAGDRVWEKGNIFNIPLSYLNFIMTAIQK